MTQTPFGNQTPFRHQSGGQINRDKPVEFEFNGKAYSGFDGDKLASALLANGVFLTARSSTRCHGRRC